MSLSPWRTWFSSKLSGVLWRWGGKRKESLQVRPWNLNICIKKVDAKCWLAEMTLVVTSLTLARAFQCPFTFALVSASRWLAEIWQFSRRGATGELEVEFKFKRHRLQALLPFPAPPPPERPGELARRLWRTTNLPSFIAAAQEPILFGCILGVFDWLLSSVNNCIQLKKGQAK